MENAVEDTYLGSDAADYMARMNAELLSELWILRDRVEILEHLLTGKGVLQSSEVDDFVPSGAFKDHIERQRNLMIENVVGAPYRAGSTVAELVARTKKYTPQQN